MTKGTYISENLTQSQLDFMFMLADYEVDIFSLEYLKDLTDDETGDINELIENLVHKKILSRIERGKYCRSNFRDEKVIGCILTSDGVIAYWSALNLHGLTEQFSNTLFIQTTKEKKEKKVFEVSYKFIRVPPSKRAGIIKQGYGNHGYSITNVEKTITDCFDLPQYSGGYAELIRAFAQTKLSSKKMIKYGKAINNIAAVKRMGFLAELFEKQGMKTFIRFAKQQVKEACNPIDPKGSNSGEYERKWRLRLNIGKSSLLDIANNMY